MPYCSGGAATASCSVSAAAPASRRSSCQQAAVAPSRRREAPEQQEVGASATVSANATDLSNLKVTELQAALAELGLPRSGRKAELLERLAAAQATAAGSRGDGGGDGGDREPGAPPSLPKRKPRRAAGLGAAAGGTAAVPTATSNSSAFAAVTASGGRADSGSGGVDSFLDLFGTLDPELSVVEYNQPAAAAPLAAARATGAAGAAVSSPAAGSGDGATPLQRRRLADSLDARQRPVGGNLAAAAAAGVAEEEGQPSASRRRQPHTGAAAPSRDDGHDRYDGDAGAGDLPREGEQPRSLLDRRWAHGDAPPPPPSPSPPADGPRGRGPQAAERARPDSEGARSRADAVEAAAGERPQAAVYDDRGHREVEGAEEDLRTPRQRSRDAASAARAAIDPATLGPAPDMKQLPPWPRAYLGHPRRIEDLAPDDPDEQESLLLSNAPGLAVTCLGSAAVCGTAERALGALALARGKDIYIFDAGDDLQRQIATAYHVKPSKIYRIFLTSLAPESVLGLPGLMCTISASRERGHKDADIPVHVYGPPGTAEFLAAVMRVSQTYLEITIVVNEICTDAVSETDSEPSLFAARARIWRQLLPPDQLNPRGGVDASLLLFAPEQGRSRREKGRNAAGGVLNFDPRAGFLPWPPLQLGDPARSGLDPLTLTWTLDMDVTARVIITLLGAPGAEMTLSYTVLEAERCGGIVLERAEAAGLVSGPGFARLKAGEAVTNSWGQEVLPSDVISPVRPGRRVVVLGTTPDPTPLASHSHAQGADLLVAGAVWPKGEAADAASAGGCTAVALGELARQLGARHVLLSRFDGRRMEQEDGGGGYTARVAAEVAAEAYGSGRGGGPHRRRVLVLGDQESLLVEKNEGSEEAPEEQ